MRAVALAVILVMAGCASGTAADPGDYRTEAAPPSGSPPAGARTLPIPAMTPGALNPAVTQATIQTTICTKGYTATIRPPVSVTNEIKLHTMAAYGYPSADIRLYELDHLISLELGGAPADVQNLWPEPWDGPQGAHVKDQVENRTRELVCNGSMPLTTAQQRIADNWITLGAMEGIVPS